MKNQLKIHLKIKQYTLLTSSINIRNDLLSSLSDIVCDAQYIVGADFLLAKYWKRCLHSIVYQAVLNKNILPVLKQSAERNGAVDIYNILSDIINVNAVCLISGSPKTVIKNTKVINAVLILYLLYQKEKIHVDKVNNIELLPMLLIITDEEQAEFLAMIMALFLGERKSCMPPGEY